MPMKILVAIDGSVHSEAAVAEVAHRTWPAGTEILVLTVIHAAAPLLPDPSLALAAAYVQQLGDQRDQAPTLVAGTCRQLRHNTPDLKVLTAIEEGIPKDVIVETALSLTTDLSSNDYSRP